VRGTLQGLAAVLGGVNALSIDCYDEAYSIPSEQAAKQSLRIHQILLHESNVANVVDPLGGSYFIETLSDELEERAWKCIEDVEKRGGWCQGVRSGYIKGEIERSSYEYSNQIWSGERIIVGVNKFTEEEKASSAELGHEYKVNEETIVERVRKFKRERDNEKVKKALDQIREAALGDKADITPVMIEAAKSKATLGEMSGVLKEVFDWRVW
jgi:methylmalonyl-CoA mutase N-terminal domain/subunit